jgi:hypothetical protein
MSNSPDPQSQPPGQWSDADDRAMDALLQQFFRQQDCPPLNGNPDSEQRSSAGPRDFTREILAKLDQSRRSTNGSGANRVYKPVAAGYGSRVPAAVRVLAVLAASVLALLAARAWKNSGTETRIVVNPSQNDRDLVALGGDGLPNSSTKATASGAVSPRGDSVTVTPEPTKPQSANKPRREPIVLSLDNSTTGPNNSPDEAAAETVLGDGGDQMSPASARIASLGNSTLQDFDRQFLTYWKSIGVTPAPAVDEATLASRIADRFGFRPASADPQPSNGTGSSASISGKVTQELASEELFSTEPQSRMLAERLVKLLSKGLSLGDERQGELVANAAEVIRSGGRFDRWISDWVAAETIPSESPGTPTAKAAAMGEWVAGRVVGTDVGCARCHDSPIDSRFNQHDYWAVAALFSPAQAESVFYEMPDGRQRVAAPGAPKRWLGLPQQLAQRDAGDAARIASREEFARSLIGNRQLARSLVNHLWSIGFGTPMVSAASSPIAPPRDDSIELALEMLSEKLIASNFDLRVAARWVVQSEPMKRGTPVELQGDAWQLADESKLVSASLAQRSFAAARSPWPTASRTQLLAMMESRSGKQPSKIGPQDSMLAQPITSSPGSPSGKPSSGSNGGKSSARSTDPQDYWWTQWLSDREGLRGGWMESITDRDQQVRHAFYAVGYQNVSERQVEWVQTLLGPTSSDSDVRNEEIAKVYWIIQNSL